MNTITDIIAKAIESKRELYLTLRHALKGTFSVTFNPYITGLDILEYEFVWGYLPASLSFYKIFADQILYAEIMTEKFLVKQEGCYQYAMEEVHYLVVPEFSNIHPQSAQLDY